MAGDSKSGNADEINYLPSPPNVNQVVLIHDLFGSSSQGRCGVAKHIWGTFGNSVSMFYNFLASNLPQKRREWNKMSSNEQEDKVCALHHESHYIIFSFK